MDKNLELIYKLNRKFPYHKLKFKIKANHTCFLAWFDNALEAKYIVKPEYERLFEWWDLFSSEELQEVEEELYSLDQNLGKSPVDDEFELLIKKIAEIGTTEEVLVLLSKIKSGELILSKPISDINY